MKKWIKFFILLLSLNAYTNVDFIEQNTSINNALTLRDPFKAPPSTTEKTGALNKKNKDGIYTNLGRADSLPLQSVNVKGVLLGPRKRAIITNGASGSVTYMLSEGAKISNGSVELKAILSTGVIFVEKITNVYGQLEYVETVVPISN